MVAGSGGRADSWFQGSGTRKRPFFSLAIRSSRFIENVASEEPSFLSFMG